jgi:hypothetical protein
VPFPDVTFHTLVLDSERPWVAEAMMRIDPTATARADRRHNTNIFYSFRPARPAGTNGSP